MDEPSLRDRLLSWLGERLTGDRVRPVLIAVVVIALGPPLVLWLVHTYTGNAIWPGLIGNTTGGLVAFVLALEFERRRELKRRQQAEDAEIERHAREERDEGTRRAQEAHRRLRLLEIELESHEAALAEIGNRLARQEVVIRPLSVGAWAVSAAALVGLLVRVELVTDLFNYYDGVEELEDLLHQRAQFHPNHETSKVLSTAASDLWRDLTARLRKLMPAVRNERASPAVRSTYLRSSRLIPLGPYEPPAS